MWGGGGYKYAFCKLFCFQGYEEVKKFGEPDFLSIHCWFQIALNISFKSVVLRGFPGGAVVENLPANAGDTGSSPGLGRSHMPRSN